MKTIDKIIRTCMALLVAGSLYFAKPAKAESEYRIITSAKVPVSKKLSIGFLSEDRYKKDNHYWDKKQIGLDYKISDFLTLSPKYARLYLNGKEGSLYGLNLGSKGKFKGINLVSGLEWEYFSYNHRLLTEPHIKISKPIKIGKGTIVPYFSNRAFFDEQLKLVEHRPGLGLEFPINRNLSLGVGIDYRDRKKGKNGCMVTGGIKFKF